MNHINFIRKIALSYHATTGIDFEELFSEASLAYCEALRKYDPTKGKVTTYTWYCIHSHLNTFLSDQKKMQYAPLETYKEVPETRASLFDNLSRDALAIANVVLSCSKKYAPMAAEDAKERIVRVLRHKGWSMQRIQQAMADMQMACQSY